MNSEIGLHIYCLAVCQKLLRSHICGAGECPVNEEAAFLKKWISFLSLFHISQLAKGRDFLVSVPGKITVVPGGTRART